jgi:hypothetical protein
VSDACGLAGGSLSRDNGAEAGDYVKTEFAQHGDVGTQILKELPGVKAPVYKRGGIAEVSWQVRNNHGGGYQYRIAPLPAGGLKDLKESMFRPLDFVEDQQAIVFPNGTTMPLTAEQTTFVKAGTLPAGGTWAMMPMPPTLLGPVCIPGTNDTATTCAGPMCQKTHSKNRCRPGEPRLNVCTPCPESPGSDCSRCDQVNSVVPSRYKTGPPFPAPCPGCEGVDWNGFAVKDVVKIPAILPAGKYILGFRYDCEATAQVWSNCADVVLE